MNKPRFFEFFAGGGMARAGLGDRWECTFANDFDPMKAHTYRANWGGRDMRLADISTLTISDLPGVPDLVWASFPCQDLSLAGNYAGIGARDDSKQTRSGSFWAFWQLMLGMIATDRPPSLIVLENVYGILTANRGRDFAMICRCLSLGGYRFGAVLLDGVRFVPQSRPRVFIISIRSDLFVPQYLVSGGRAPDWHPPAMAAAVDRLAEPDFNRWLWLVPPLAVPRSIELADLIEPQPTGVEWHGFQETMRLVAMMSAVSLAKLAKMRASSARAIGTIYKRTRFDDSGNRVQRAELRDDGIAGCLRTPGGGSSRQTIIIAENGRLRSRLLSPREAARLMGLPDSYKLPARYNDAYHVAGDGIVVPVVSHLAKTILEPILACNRVMAMAAE